MPADLSIASAVDQTIRGRRSIRAFLPTPVSRETVEDILEVASRAPSGTNVQPWKVWALSGESKRELSRQLIALFDDPEARKAHRDEYPYYPKQWVSPYIERRRKVGLDLYRLLGIQKGDDARMHAQHARNFAFFDAPVGLFFTIDRVLEQGSWLDYGMFVQNVMLAARARGLDTCPQVAFIHFHQPICRFLGVPEDQMLVCGMSLGFADPHAPENGLVTEREPVANFVRFQGFET